jgi:hypothetical protein
MATLPPRSDAAEAKLALNELETAAEEYAMAPDPINLNRLFEAVARCQALSFLALRLALVCQ